MLTILSEGDRKYRLEDSTGTAIGWIRGSTIGFRGFVTESDAREAAVAAWKTLGSSLRSEYPGWPRHEPLMHQLRTVHDGAHEWFSDGTLPIARLLRPHGRAYDSSYGIELVLPSFAREGMAISASQNLAVSIAPFRDVLHPTRATTPVENRDRESHRRVLAKDEHRVDA